ncbi:MAG TPA: hypothetical protein VFS55_15055, partial [Dokdonella sp.]|nr:hypothetical protein [Dokdonella sp.]
MADEPGHDALARCAEWLHGDPALATRLASIASPDDFRAALLAAVEASGRVGDLPALASIAFDRAAPARTPRAAWPPAQRRGWQP